MPTKDMSLVYSLMPLKNLKELRSKKILRLDRIEGSTSWFNLQECRKLRQQIRWIDAELNCRADQMSLL